MTETLTIETVRAAQANDLAALTEVLAALDTRIALLADQHARRIGYNVADYREDFEQTARVAAWEALSRFGEAESIDQFFAYAFRTMDTVLRDAVRTERNPGADKDALKVFAYWVAECDGDVYEAERRSQEVPAKGSKIPRLGRDRAYAARMAYQGSYSLDAPAPGSENDEDGGVTYADVVSAEEWVPDDLMDERDRDVLRRAETAERVNHCLARMGETQAVIMRATFGIGDMGSFASKRGENADTELADLIGIPRANVQSYRAKGYKAFAKRWIPMVSLNDDEAAAWWTAYEETRALAKVL